MPRHTSSPKKDAKAGSTVKSKDGRALAKGHLGAGRSRHAISDEVASQDEQRPVPLMRIGARLASSNLGELLAPTVPFLGHLIPGAESCVIFFSDPVKHQLSLGASVNLSQDFINLLHAREQEESLITAALERPEPHVTMYLPGNKRFESLWKLAHREGIRTLWLVPWRDRDGDLLGALLFASGQAFSPSKQALASATLLTEWMSAALHEAQARQDNERLRVALNSINELGDDTDRTAVIDQALKQSTTSGQDQTVEGHDHRDIPRSVTGGSDTQSVVVPRYKDKHGIPVLYDSSAQERKKRAEPDGVSVLSHELLSPLTLIKGYTATLQQLADAITEEQRKQYLQGIGSATDRVIRLLEDLRNISRSEAATSDLIIQPTSLPDLLRKTVSEVQRQTTKHVIRLRQVGPLPPANVDQQKIEQVMTNLLVNALKYSPQGGDIEAVVWQAHSEHESEEALGEVPPVKFPCLIVSVTDSGIGMPEAELERVFERFYRVDNRLTRSTSGAGLGLYICKIIIEGHGGHIWAKSSLEEGSTFSFSLPVS